MTVLLVVGLGARVRPAWSSATSPARSRLPRPARRDRRYQLGLQFSRDLLLREMNSFGMPLVPAALAPGVDQLQRPLLPRPVAGLGRGRASTRSACGSRRRWCLLLTAFRIAWPAFAYSIEDDARGEADVRVRAHIPASSSRRWLALALGVARTLARAAADDRAGVLRGRDDVVALLAFAAMAYAALHRDRDRRRPGAADAVQLGRSPVLRRWSTSA